MTEYYLQKFLSCIGCRRLVCCLGGGLARCVVWVRSSLISVKILLGCFVMSIIVVDHFFSYAFRAS